MLEHDTLEHDALEHARTPPSTLSRLLGASWIRETWPLSTSHEPRRALGEEASPPAAPPAPPVNLERTAPMEQTKLLEGAMRGTEQPAEQRT